MKPKQIGRYKVVECKDSIGSKFWRVYQDGVTDALSDHAEPAAACSAAKRYQANDERRRAQATA